MKNLSILFFCICILMSCKRVENPSNDFIRNLNPTSDPIEGSPAYSKAEIIKLETTPSCLMDQIKQVEINDSYIFVLDYKKLYSFTREGKFIAQIGEKGEGPNEYIGLSTFYVNNAKQQVTIVDNCKHVLINYDFEGKYLSTISVPQNSFQCWNYSLLTADNKLLGYSMMSMYDTKAYSLFDLEKNEISGHYFSYQPITVDNYMYAFSSHPIAISNKDIDFIMPLCDTIYSYSSASSSFYPKYIIETPQKIGSKEQIRKNTPSYGEDIYKLAEQGYFPGFISIFETDTKVLLGYRHQGVQVAYFLFDKSSKAGNYYSINWNETTETLPFFSIIHTYKNSFVGQIDATGIASFKNIKDKKMKTIIESLKEDDNPCLVLYEF